MNFAWSIFAINLFAAIMNGLTYWARGNKWNLAACAINGGITIWLGVVLSGWVTP